MSWCILPLKRDFCATVISSEIKKPSLWFQKPIFQFIFKKIYCVFLHLISHPFVSSWCERQYCFCVPVAPAETFSPAAFSPTTFQLSVPDEHMYILQWAWVLDEERCESFWLFNVCYIKRASVSAGVAALWRHSQLGLGRRIRLRIWKKGNFSRS